MELSTTIPTANASPGEADDVERAPERVHREKRSDHRDRDRDRDDQRRPGTSEVQHQHEDGEEAADEQTLLHEGNRTRDVLGLVVGLDEPESLLREKVFVEGRDFGLEPVHDFENVRARFADGVGRNDMAAFVKDSGRFFPIAEPGTTDVAQINRHPVPDRDDDVFDVLG